MATRLGLLGTRLEMEARVALRSSRPLAIAAAVLFVSLLLVRHRLVGILGIDYAEAIASGRRLGWVFDLWGVLVALFVAQALSGVLALDTRIGWAFGALTMWLASFGNVLHTQFFGTQLDLWVVALHWDDLVQVRGSVAQLGSNWPLATSALLCLVAGLLPIVGRRIRWLTGPMPEAEVSFWHRRARGIAHGLLLLATFSIVHRLPLWLDAGDDTSPLATNIVRVWTRQLTSDRLFAGVGIDWTESLPDDASFDPDAPGRQLARFRDFGQTVDQSQPRSESLRRELVPDPEATRASRRRLGLPESGPLNVVLLFLESVRAFEVFDGDFGPELFPELREILAKHAIEYRQAYTSSYNAGQTVRGQFSTLCSMLPNMAGAATYIAHKNVEVRCLPELLVEHGYVTTWMNSFKDTFHGKRAFEAMHGTQLFFDGDDLRARGVTETVGGWGLADAPFLREVVSILEELAEQGAPVFVNALTISAHHPYRTVPQGKLTDEAIALTDGNEYYRKFLTGLRYEGIAVAGFFERLFASPIAERTLVVLLADHGAGVMATNDAPPVQFEETRFRIPLAFVTRDLPEPEVVTFPVHQIDIAPTIATIVGLSGEVTWVGRDLMSGSGSPWIYQAGDSISYRYGGRACYTHRNRPLRCVEIGNADPLFDGDLLASDEDPKLTRFSRDTVRANMLAIVLNLVH